MDQNNEGQKPLPSRFLRSGQDYHFDYTGKLQRSAKQPPMKHDFSKTHFRIRPLEKWMIKWMRVGCDMRNNFYSMGMTVACFFVTFWSTIAYEKRHLRVQALAGVEKDYLDKKLFGEFMEREGKLWVLDMNENFFTI